MAATVRSLAPLFDQAVNQRIGLTGGAASGEHYGRAVLDTRHGIAHGLDDLAVGSHRGVLTWE